MKHTSFLWPLLVLVLAAGCEHEVDIDYHTTEPHYVAEVEQTPDEITARITTTRDVTEASAEGTYVNDAIVTLRMEGSEWVDTLEAVGRGRYRLDYFAYEGHEYLVDIIIDGQHHTSSSAMHSMPQVSSFNFVWQDVLTEQMLFADLRLQDNADENNYYFMHLYRNGVGYRWAVSDDRANPGGELQQLFSCTTKRQMEQNSDKDVLRQGDVLRLEVRAIDSRAYDYLYSLQFMDNTGTNPVANFSGGLLGYYSAFQQATIETVFHPDSIR